MLGTEFFRVSAETWSDGRSIVSEPANEGGVLAQMMRHTEAIMRTGVTGSEKTLQAAHKMIEQTAKRAEFAEAKFLEMLTTVHTFITQERETKVAMVKAEARAEVVKQIGGKITSIIPQISAAFLSGNAGPQGPEYAAALQARELFSSITQEQLQGMLGHLNGGQQMAFFGIMKALAKAAEQQKGAADKPAAATGGGNGANGAQH
ncbi:MAG TPA: hypothetical protein VJN18_11025 [Polyangiaceae bacterium]|nr:hypothetical protein [Polyangiaceae bacterium]